MICGVELGILIFLLFGIGWFDSSNILPGSILEKLLPYTEATISQLTYHKDSDGDYYRADFTYTVKGKNFSGHTSYQLDNESIPQMGEQISVYYFNFYPSYAIPNPSSFFFIAAVGLIVITVFMALIMNLVFGIPIRPAD